MYEAYGPHANIPDAEFSSEARDGALYALERASTMGSVRVTSIVFSTVDTRPLDVKAATAFAVWNALEHEPTDPPRLDGSEIVFP